MTDDTLPPPPALPADAALFLDFDGTLVELVHSPDAVLVDEALTGLLGALWTRFGDRLALVSGRSVAQLDELLGDAAARLTLAGSHGSEARWQGVLETPERPAGLAEAEAEMELFVREHPGLLVERKTLGTALHYRALPALEETIGAFVSDLAGRHGLHHQPGKMMAELRLAGQDKGTAIAAFLARPEFAGTTPVFVGDDLTDEHGFEAVAAAGGWGVLVGLPRPTMARYRLQDVAAVRRWLAEALQETT